LINVKGEDVDDFKFDVVTDIGKLNVEVIARQDQNLWMGEITRESGEYVAYFTLPLNTPSAITTKMCTIEVGKILRDTGDELIAKSITAIVAQLGSQAQALQLEMPTEKKERKSWTRQEHKLLLQLYFEKKSLDVIAAELNRTTGAVRMKINHLLAP
jgi:hypothetical protein